MVKGVHDMVGIEGGGGCVGISTGYKHMEGYNVVVSVCS